jgi:hypothetical protein
VLPFVKHSATFDVLPHVHERDQVPWLRHAVRNLGSRRARGFVGTEAQALERLAQVDPKLAGKLRRQGSRAGRAD